MQNEHVSKSLVFLFHLYTFTVNLSKVKGCEGFFFPFFPILGLNTQVHSLVSFGAGCYCRCFVFHFRLCII